ncbi:MAG: Ppx/GppA family phosphatase [Gemmatimonadota bacterium]|nr:MAG: Ppx/GppA family phosphatase [Gemmatimonadota bacterium]
MSEPDQLRLGAIDIGTNTIRLVVVEVEDDGTYRVLENEREMTRLGHGLYESGRLSEESMELSLQALGRMKTIAEGLGVTELQAIATAAVREASNGRTFRRRAERQHGLRIRVINSREEARLAFLSFARQFSLDGRPVAMVDIGGGSVEVVLAAGTLIDRVYSLPLGALRLTEGWLHNDPITKKDWSRLKKTIDNTIKRRIGKPPFKVQTLVGSGGTFSTLGSIAKSQREGNIGSVQGYSLSRVQAVEILRRLRQATIEERRQMGGLSPDRADIIVAGIAVIARLAKHLGCSEIRVNEGGVREGLFLSMIAERRKGKRAAAAISDRMEWVRKFARKSHWNEAHCEHVANLSIQIFDCLQQKFDLPEPGREILQAAALLHDIGYLIGHAKHHKHAYHLIMYGDLPAFSAREVELIANVARYHRRAFPKKSHTNFARLQKSDRRLVRNLSGILRVADGLDRAHAQSVTSIACHVNKNRISMRVEAEAPPQVELWDANRKAGLLEKVLDRRLELEWAGADAAAVLETRVDRPGTGRKS